jgi:heme A synthase
VRLRGQGRLGWGFGLGLAALILVGASGAVTALGDTLFPAGSLAEGIQQDLSPTAHILVQLRVIHPILAIATGVYAIVLGSWARLQRPSPTMRRLANALIVIVAAQLVAGIVNLALLAPVVMQLVHLLLADLLWLAFVLAAATALAAPASVPEPDRAADLALRPSTT